MIGHSPKPLVIDPVLSYSTYLGGNNKEYAWGIAVDASSNAYITGYTFSTDFPLSSPIQANLQGDQDVFVAKINADGTALLYSTYLGGSNREYAGGIAVDSSGNAYISGTTKSTDFPLSSSVIQGDLQGGSDAFVAKINADGTALLYSTYLGGSGNEEGDDIALDTSGNVCLVGHTQSTDFPGASTSPIQADLHGGGDAFVTKINIDGNALLYSTYLGGSFGEEGDDIAVDSSGNAYITGITYSTDFTGTSNSPIQSSLHGNADAFVAKINADGTALLYSTYLGGKNYDVGLGIAADSLGNAYLTGGTLSFDLPCTSHPIQAGLQGYSDAFVAKINADGTQLIYSTYLGGSDDDEGSALAVDSSGNAYLTGYTHSSDFPGASISPIQANRRGYGDAFVARINPSGSALIFSTYLGGNDYDGGRSIAIDSNGNAYVMGWTQSPDFPGTSVSPIQSVYSGSYDYDVFVAKVTPIGVSVSASPDSPQLESTPVAFTVTGQPIGSYQYKFWLKTGNAWAVVQNWSANNVWNWDTEGAAPGIYVIRAGIRQLGSTGGAESSQTIRYVLKGPIPTGVSLSPSLPSPGVTGASVNFVATGQPIATYQYRFRLKTGSTWAVVQNWSTSSVWNWNTSGAAAGTYSIQVGIRQVGSTGGPAFNKTISYTLH